MLDWMQRFLNWKWAPWCVGCVVSVIAMLVGVLFDGAAIDMMTRYAPMAEAFAEGNWQEFFHPRFPMLFQCCAGVLVYVTGLPGDLACILLSTCLWGVVIPWLFLVAERLFGRQCAWVTVGLYCICPMLLTWAFFGLREPLRTLGMVWCVLAILRRMDGERALGLLCAGLFVLCLVRSDTLLQAGFLWCFYAWFDRFRWQTWCAAAWAALSIQPLCWVTWTWLGVWLPSTQWVLAWERLF